MERDFLDQLTEFSQKAVEILCGPGKTQSTKHSGDWKHGQPSGMTLHYTAGQQDRVESVLNYFIRNKSDVSSWCFILDGKHPKLIELEKDYPLVASLPATVIEFGPIDKVYWHAGWVNRIHVGIDLRNAGSLQESHGKFRDAYGRPYEGRRPVKVGPHYWEPYTKQQISTCVTVCRIVKNHFKMKEPARFLPHSASKGTKLDTGPHFPMTEVRGAVYDIKPPLESLPDDWWEKECINGLPEDSYLGGKDLMGSSLYDHYWHDEIEEALDEITEDETTYNFGVMNNRFYSYQKGLKELQYYVNLLPFPEHDLTPEIETATRYFQRAHNLKVDGKPGPETFRAMDRARKKAWK